MDIEDRIPGLEGAVPAPAPEEHHEPFEGDALRALLRAPGTVVARLAADRDLWGPALVLLAWGLVFHAVFGFAMGLYGGWGTALMAAAKAPLIVLCALALCVPSLHIFSCVADMPITLAQTLLLGTSVVAMTGLLLVALAPVTWLFAVSTDSLAFVVVLNVAIWFLCVGFSLRLFGRLSVIDPVRHAFGAKWWLVIYVVVSLQMATTMRPLLGTPAEGWWTPGKKFFVAHFIDSIDEGHAGGTPPGM